MEEVHQMNRNITVGNENKERVKKEEDNYACG